MSAGRFDALTAPLTTGGLLEALAEGLAAEWGETLGEAQPLPGAEIPWQEWLPRHFAEIATAPLAEHHERLWGWFEALEPGVRQRPFVEAWNRGGAKSTTVELAVARAIVRASRSCVLYVCATQDAADKHIQDIQAPLEQLGVGRQESRYGTSRGWRQDFLRTENHVAIMGIGLDKPVRGLKIGNRRPDLIIFDDIDDEADGPQAVKRKLDRITRTILAARAPHCAVVFIQNLIHAGGIMAQLKVGRNKILQDRFPYQEVPAIRGLAVEEQLQEDGTLRDVIVAGEPSWEGLPIEACQAAIDDLTLPVFLAEYQHVLRQGGSIFFPELLEVREGKPWHIVSPSIIRDIPAHWKGAGGLDYGTRAPFAFVLDRVGPRSESITTHEIYLSGLTSAQQAAKVRELLVAQKLSLDTPIYADPAMFPPAKAEDRVGTYPADDYWAAGLNVIPAQNSRIAGWNRMREDLVRTVGVPSDDGEGFVPVPAWRIVGANCPNLVRQIEDAVSDKEHPDELDEGCEDHALDAMRYRRMGPAERAGEDPAVREEREKEKKLLPLWVQQLRRKRDDYV